MANEIQAMASLVVANGSLNEQFRQSKNVTEAAVGAGGGSQSIPTTAAGTAITGLSGLSSLGWGYAVNLDATNYVEIGVQVAATFYPVVRLEAGEFSLFRFVPGVSYYARANTAAVLLSVRVYED